MNHTRFSGSGVLRASLLLAALLGVACSSTVSGLKTRFAHERGCPVDQVAVRASGGSVYRANGCGHDTEYICESFAGLGSSAAEHCRERGLRPHEPPGVPPSTMPPMRPDLEGPK